MALLIIFFLLFLVCVLLFKAVRVLPIFELRRQAKSGDSVARSIYKAASFGMTLDVALWLLAASFLSLAVVTAFEISAWIAVALIFLATLAITFIRLPIRQQGPIWLIAKWAAYPAVAAASALHPLTNIFFKDYSLRKSQSGGVFEKQDLINMIRAQKNLSGNRISIKDLQMVEAALKFSGKTVNEAMVVGSKQCFVSGNEPIGPLLMDELHSGGRFAYLVTKGPVRKQGSKPIGTVFMRDLVGRHVSGQVKDVAQEQVYYINEAQSIGDALEAMLKTQFPILAVINNFEEVSGVISLEDIIGQLLPDFMSSDFENYANAKAVANWQPDTAAGGEGRTAPSEKSGN